ncbi:glycosyl hydrolase family 61-domain-containing protein [Trametes elegans]|nr:glycosyl hydrolase family 61-domain-containing protein [Trametes elegans]
MKHAALAALFSALLPYVAAHGYFGELKIDGKSYVGNAPGNANKDSPIRLIADINPIKGASNPDLVCGKDAKPAKLVADANPGSVLEIGWNGGGEQKWPHKVGPLITYLGSCGSQSCADADPANIKWFKVDQVDKEPNDKSKWVHERFTPPPLVNGQTYTVKLPDNIAPGNYMLRHEASRSPERDIIALHLATAQGGAEFYAGCAQLKIGGSGSGAPDASELVTFPGAYSDSDPGIFDPNIFDVNAKYDFPGPKVAKLAAAASGGGASSGDNNAATGSGAGSGADSSAAASGTKGGASSTPAASSAAATATAKGTKGDASSTPAAPSAAATATAKGTKGSKGSKGQCRSKRSTHNAAADRSRQEHSRAVRRLAHASY